MLRPAFTAAATALLLASLALTAAPGAAATRKKADPEAAKLAQDSGKEADKKGDAAAGKPVQVATFGDWGAYLAKGKAKTCYALASPQERHPEAKHDAAYVFIADRPGEKVHNEVSIIMGFPMKGQRRRPGQDRQQLLRPRRQGGERLDQEPG